MGAKTIEIEASHLALISHPDAITNSDFGGTVHLRPATVEPFEMRRANERIAYVGSHSQDQNAQLLVLRKYDMGATPRSITFHSPNRRAFGYVWSPPLPDFVEIRSGLLRCVIPQVTSVLDSCVLFWQARSAQNREEPARNFLARERKERRTA